MSSGARPGKRTRAVSAQERSRRLSKSLSLACAHGRLEKITGLLARGAPVNPGGDFPHHPPLIDCVEMRQWGAMAMLLAAGAEPNAQAGADGDTALLCAISTFIHSDERIAPIQMLLAAGADACARTLRHQHTGAHLLALGADEHYPREALQTELLRNLSACGLPLDALDFRGQTALHICMLEDNALIARELLALGADPFMGYAPEDSNLPLLMARRFARTKNLILCAQQQHALALDLPAPQARGLAAQPLAKAL